MSAPKSVWLLTIGDGSDGNEWDVISIHSTKEGAESAKAHHESLIHTRMDGSIYHIFLNPVEEWPIDEIPESQQEAKTP